MAQELTRQTAASVPSSLPIPVNDTRNFVTAGALSSGDCVFDRSGETVRVKYARPAERSEGYMIHLSDGSHFTASGDTELAVRSRMAYYKNARPDNVRARELASREMRDEKNRCTHYIGSCGPVDRAGSLLPVHPYLMGLVLSVGHVDGMTGRVTFRTMDRDMLLVAAVLADYSGVAMADGRDGYWIFRVENGVAEYFTEDVLSERVPETVAFRLLGAARTVPVPYMYSDIESRRWLLKGLMDGAGWVDVKHGMTCRFAHGAMVLTRCVAELAWSLGYSCSVNHKFTDGMPSYRADFRVDDSEKASLFHADSKLRLVWGGRKNGGRYAHRFDSKGVDRIARMSVDFGPSDGKDGVACTEIWLDMSGRNGPATVLAGRAYVPVGANRA